jgi:small subunit ribosomal protein S1
MDESYWQALMEHGEIAPEPAPQPPQNETFRLLGLEMEQMADPTSPSTDRGNGPDSNDEWQAAQTALEQGEVFCLKISGANRGGVLVEWNGVQGFVPASHLLEAPRFQDSRARMNKLADRIGDSLTLRLIEVDIGRKRLVFSERAAASDSKSPASIFQTLRPGDVCQGTVTNVTTFGAFVDLGGVEGLVHISEISWDRVRHPGDLLNPGQQVEVFVVGVNPDQGRIALSLKRLRPDPWADVESRYQIGEIIEGTVTNVVSFGAFVRVEEGLEGLIHISEMAEGNFLHPRSVVHEGEQVQVRVLNVNQSEQRLGLSLRQAHNPDQASTGVRQGHGTPA